MAYMSHVPCVPDCDSTCIFVHDKFPILLCYCNLHALIMYIQAPLDSSIEASIHSASSYRRRGGGGRAAGGGANEKRVMLNYMVRTMCMYLIYLNRSRTPISSHMHA